MSLLKLRMRWLKPAAVGIIVVFAVAAPVFADPRLRSATPEQSPKTEQLPALAAASDPQSPAPPPPMAQNQAPSPAPGQFKVDKEAAERALERALVVQGAMLLPFGVAEFQPSFSYTRSEVNDLGLAIQDGTPFLIERDAKRNALTAELFFRFGLPFDSQLEFGIPYRYIESEEISEISLFGRNVVNRDSSGFGDFRLGLAKGLLREGRWWPNLIGRVIWDTDSGETDTLDPLGSGFNELTGSLTATKRQDPLVFIGSVSYTTSFEEDNVDPGDALGFSVGALLAASPETSLRVIFNQSFVDDIEIGGRTIEGTDQVVASLGFGASSIVGHGKFLDFTATTGLTDDAPEYSIGITLVIRFDVPSLPF